MKKNSSLKMSLLSTAMICAAGFSSVSMAHFATGTLPNTDAGTASAIDVYHTSCFTWNPVRTVQLTDASTPAQRFVARALNACTTQNAACNPNAAGGSGATSRVRVSVGSPNGNTPLAGVTSVTTGNPTVNGGGFQPDVANNPAIWADNLTKGAWVQTRDNLGADANGTYTVAVSHLSGQANNYIAQFHCENVAVGALPAPDSSGGIHTGTGVNTGANPNSWIDVPNNSNNTAADFNQFIDQ